MQLKKQRKRLSLSLKAKKVLVLIVLLISIFALYQFEQQRPMLDQAKVRVPLSKDLKEMVENSKDASEIVEVATMVIYNAWLSEHALKNGGWKNITPLLTDAFAKRITKDTALQNAISVGDKAGKIDRIKLSKKKSRLFNLQIGKTGKEKGKAIILADLEMRVDHKHLQDFNLRQQAIFYLMKDKEEDKWRIYNIFVYKAEEKSIMSGQ